jgi:hypothetical protein
MKYLLIIITILFYSCQEEKYPKYELTTMMYVPDSLKVQYADYIKELVRASNQHLSAGDYEHIDRTIKQAENIANNLFAVKTIGLQKCIDDNYWNCFELKKNELNEKEIKIFDSLMSN